MGDEIELFSDGDGLAVIGDPVAVERFLAAEGLSSKDLGLARLAGAARTGSAVTQAGAEMAANSGRWVQLTKESAEAVKKFGLMDSKTPGVKHAMVGQPGDIKKWIQIAKAPGSMLSNPAMLAGAAGIMAQMAMQQQMEAITDYLAAIDEKLDDLLRAQTNQMLARLDAVELAIREAMKVRGSVGRVSEVTWSKVQNLSTTVLETQGFVLRQLGDLADKVESLAKVDELATAAKKAESDVRSWLTVLASCIRLHDAFAVLELDRVLDSSPDELDRHRVGLQAAREDRLELVASTTGHLLTRMSAAAQIANSKVLLHPTSAPAIVKSGNQVTVSVHGLREVLGIESGGESLQARRWTDAAGDSWDKVRESGEGGIDSVKRFGSGTRTQALSMKAKLSERLAQRKSQGNEANEDG
jgi:hypothetical protein